LEDPDEAELLDPLLEEPEDWELVDFEEAELLEEDVSRLQVAEHPSPLSVL